MFLPHSSVSLEASKPHRPLLGAGQRLPAYKLQGALKHADAWHPSKLKEHLRRGVAGEASSATEGMAALAAFSFRTRSLPTSLPSHLQPRRRHT